MNKDTVTKKIELALLALSEEIQKGNQGLQIDGPLPQLAKFKEYLSKALVDLNQGKPGYTIGFGRVIMDSWSYDSKLGSVLLDAERAFSKVKP